MTYRYIFNQIFKTLNRSNKFILFVTLIAILLSALLEMLTISSLIPFLNIMLSPDVIYENFKYKYLVISEEQFLNNPLGYISTIFIIVISAATILKLLVLKLILKVTTIIGTKISATVFKNIISQSYISFTKFNTSELISVLEAKVDPMVNAIFRLLQTVTAIIITIAIITTLLLINFWSTIFFSLSFSISYFFIFYFYKRKLTNLGNVIATNLKSRVKISQEAMSIFRQVKLDNLSDNFYSNFTDKDFKIRKGNEIVAYVGNFPRIVIEYIAIVLIAIGSYLLISNDIYGEDYTLTLVASIVFGASRLLPQVQIIYQNFSQIVAFKRLYLDVIKFLSKENFLSHNSEDSKKLIFKNKIKLENVTFGYEPNKNILENVNIEISKNSTIGILGKTGSGKTTLIDLISGLLEPEKGKIVVDDVAIKSSLKNWYKKISYIDQNVTLIDGPLIENIAIGQKQNDIDIKNLEKVLENSQSKEFIDNLPKKYYTLVGERGIRLSGGQIQRIGIARALFKNSELLILDEPTSSLDVNTENLVINAIEGLKKEKTVILISHRLNALKNCDKIFEIKNQKVNEVKI